MNWAQIAAPLAVVFGGVASGIMLSTVVGIVPMFLAQQYSGYVRSVQFLWPRYDPMMPILNGTTLLLSVSAAVTAAGSPARPVLVASSVLLLGVMAISIVKNVPVNKFVSRLDPDAPPADWATVDPRVRWRFWNTTRTTLAVLAFASNVTATALLN